MSNQEKQPETLPAVPAETAAPAVAPAPLSKSDKFLAIVEALANNPSIDSDKLQKMMDMQLQIMEKDAEIAFNNDMARLRADLPTVVKNRDNDQTKSKYADLEAIKKAVDPILAKHGFYDRYEADYPDKNTIGMTCEIVHRDGHSKKNRVQIPIDDKGIKGVTNKTEPHAVASSMTYCQRLSFCNALSIRVGKDDDGNAAGSQSITGEQVKKIDDLLTETNTNKLKFLAFIGSESVEKILTKDYARAINMLEAKKIEQQATKKPDNQGKE